MPITDRSLPEPDSRALLEAACARSLPIDLHTTGPGGELFVSRSRILGMDGEHVFVDSPQAIGKQLEFEPRQAVTVHFNLHESRYLFESHIVRRKSLIPLNDQKSVVGMLLARPRRIRDGQRRNHFRVSLVAEEKMEVRLHKASSEDGRSCPVDGSALPGILINLSLGGVALRVDMDAGRTLSLDDVIFVRFFLPDEEQEYVLMAQVRQLRPISDNSGMRLGVSFKPWPEEREYERTQQRLQRYITRVQREQLKRAG